MYFSIGEPFDLAYEIGGILYDLGYYRKALLYFAHSNIEFGDTADAIYNQALCHYQLKEDGEFERVKEAGKGSEIAEKRFTSISIYNYPFPHLESESIS